MTTPDPADLADAIDRIIDSARRIDFDLIHGRQEAVAQLMINVRYFGDLIGALDPFETSGVVTSELRHRRGLK